MNILSVKPARNVSPIIGRESQMENRVDNVFDSNFESFLMNFENQFKAVNSNFPANNTRIQLIKNLQEILPTLAYYIVDALYKTRNVPGVVCEFGVGQGSISQLIANEIIDGEKNLHLFDPFDDVILASKNDTLRSKHYNRVKRAELLIPPSYSIHSLVDKLTDVDFPIDRLVIHGEFIEEKPALPSMVSFALINESDRDATTDILNYLHEVSGSGSVVLVNNYEEEEDEIALALDRFLDSHKEEYNLYVPDKSFGKFGILTKL